MWGIIKLMSSKLASTKLLSIVLVLVLVFGVINFLRPLPQIKPTVSLASSPASLSPKIAWPAKGQSAVGAVGFGVLDSSPNQKPVPIASIAKVLTALAVLKQKPIAVGEQGPQITLGKEDVAIYKGYLAKNGSVVPVTAGEKITQYQALQAMLIPSSNNMADSLALWAFGSVDAYIVYANQLAKTLGLNNTVVADASGFSPKTKSTAHDLVILGQAALANPIISKIVNQKQAKLPVAGLVTNTNWLIGVSGINGIKTGHTNQSGGCYLYSSTQKIGGHFVTLIGAVVGASDLPTAISNSKFLLNASYRGFQTVTIVQPGQTVAYYQKPWGGTAIVTAKKKLETLSWGGATAQIKVGLKDLKNPVAGGSEVGQLSVISGNETPSTTLVLKEGLTGPSWSWRLIRM